MAEVSTLTPSPPALGDPHAAPSIPLPSTVAPGANSPAPEPSKEMPIPKSSLYNNPALMGATAPPPAKNSTLVSQTPTHGPPPTHSNSSSVPEEVAAENPGAPLLDGAAPQSQEGTGNDTERGVDPGQACEQESNDRSAAADLLNATPEGLVQSTQQAPLTPDMNPLPNLYPDVHVTHIPDPAPEDAPFTEAQPSDPAASDPAPAASDPAPAASDPAPAASDPAPAATDPAQTPPPPTTTAVAEENSPQSPPPQQQAPNPQPQPPARSLKPATPVGVRKAELPSSTPSSPVPVINEPASSSSNLFLPNPNARPAPDTMSYLESASLMSGTLESLSGLEDGSSIGSDSEISGMTVRRTDKYGFLGGNQYSEGGEKDIRLEVARQREMKWLDMFNNWDKWIKHRFQKVKLRCRKGIPSSLRSKAWQLLSNSKELLDTNPGKFEELEREPGEAKWLDIIEKDLHRQFPFHEMFAARGGHGQQDLYRILKAYTVYRPDEGYCQAQAPVAAVLLMHMPAEQAFWCLVQICEKYLPGYYSAGLEAIQLDGEIFFSLLRRTCPMAYRHLKKFKIDPILYMTEWFMCVFSRTLPWACVLRVWDMFFCEGVKIVFRVGLVLLKQMLGSVDKLRELQGMYETMERLRSISPDTIKEDILVQEIIAIPVTEALIERECSIQVRKWRESRGELTHQPGRRLHGTRAIHEYKRRASAISSGGSFFSLSSSIPPPGPLRASSSLLSLPGFRRSKTPFRSDKKGSFSGPSGMAGLPPQPPPSSSSNQAQSTKPPMSGAAPRAPAPHVQSPLVGSGSSTSPGPAQVSEATAIQGQPSAPAPNQNTPPSTLLPPPKVVSEQFTTTLPSPTANNTPLPPANNAPLLPANNAPLPLANNAPLPPANNAPLPPAKKALLPPANKAPLPPCSDGLKEVATAGGEEEGKKKKKSKEDKKKEREDDKQKLKEKKEKEKAEKERIKKDRERMEKDKKKEKGGKKKDKGGGGEAGEKNGAAAARDLV